jgi:hypothetical protein
MDMNRGGQRGCTTAATRNPAMKKFRKDCYDPTGSRQINFNANCWNAWHGLESDEVCEVCPTAPPLVNRWGV